MTIQNASMSNLESRWAGMWDSMEGAALEVLVVYGINALGHYGNICYLTDSLPSNKGSYVVLQRDRPPILVASSPLEQRSLHHEIETRIDIGVPTGAGRAAQLSFIAGLGRDRRVAVAGPPDLPHSDAVLLNTLLGDELPVVDLVAETRRALTARDHWCLRAEAARIEDALQSLPGSLWPGATERDIAAVLESQMVRRGSQIRIIHVCREHFHGQPPSDAIVRDGDLVTIFVESTSTAGHWVELGVLGHVGSVSAARRNQTQLIQATLRRLQRDLVAGRAVADVRQSAVSALERYGTATIGLGHGAGLDEHPWPSDTTAGHHCLLRGEAVAVHPSLEAHGDRSTAAAAANTFIVGPTAAAPLSQLPFTTLVL